MVTLQLKRTTRSLDDEIINTFVPDVGEPFLVETASTSSGTFETNECMSFPSDARKDIYAKEEDWDLIEFDSEAPVGIVLPKIGQTFFVKFYNQNTVVNPSLSVVVGTTSTTARNIAYRDGNSYNTNILDSIYNWRAGETRVFTFNGTYWIVQLPENYIDSSLLFIGTGADTVRSLYESGSYITVSKYISSDMLLNGSITLSKLGPDVNIATKESIQQIQKALDDYQDETLESLSSINDKMSVDKIYYVNCNSAPNNVKRVTIPGILALS